MSGYPNPWKLWCGPGTPGFGLSPEECDAVGGKQGLLGRGLPIPAITGCRNLRWKIGYNERATHRQQLRRAFGNYWIIDSGTSFGGTNTQLFQTAGDPAPLGSLTPFRRAMNAGDPFSKINTLPSSTLVPKPSNQVQGSRRASNQAAASTAGSGRKTVPNGSAYTGNPRYVYDSSDYIRFKKLQAKNRNYNDPTFGGDMHNASQVALSRVRH